MGFAYMGNGERAAFLLFFSLFFFAFICPKAGVGRGEGVRGVGNREYGVCVCVCLPGSFFFWFFCWFLTHSFFSSTYRARQAWSCVRASMYACKQARAFSMMDGRMGWGRTDGLAGERGGGGGAAAVETGQEGEVRVEVRGKVARGGGGLEILVSAESGHALPHSRRRRKKEREKGKEKKRENQFQYQTDLALHTIVSCSTCYHVNCD